MQQQPGSYQGVANDNDDDIRMKPTTETQYPTLLRKHYYALGGLSFLFLVEDLFFLLVDFCHRAKGFGFTKGALILGVGGGRRCKHWPRALETLGTPLGGRARWAQHFTIIIHVFYKLPSILGPGVGGAGTGTTSTKKGAPRLVTSLRRFPNRMRQRSLICTVKINQSLRSSFMDRPILSATICRQLGADDGELPGPIVVSYNDILPVCLDTLQMARLLSS